MTNLVFDTKFHDADTLIEGAEADLLKYDQLNKLSEDIQDNITASSKLKEYALNLWKSTSNPELYGLKISDIDIKILIISGASPRGISMMMKCARVNAWMNDRDHVQPIDVEYVFHAVMAHRLVVNRIYENNKTELLEKFTQEVLLRVATPKLD